MDRSTYPILKKIAIIFGAINKYRTSHKVINERGGEIGVLNYNNENKFYWDKKQKQCNFFQFLYQIPTNSIQILWCEQEINIYALIYTILTFITICVLCNEQMDADGYSHYTLIKSQDNHCTNIITYFTNNDIDPVFDTLHT